MDRGIRLMVSSSSASFPHQILVDSDMPVHGRVQPELGNNVLASERSGRPPPAGIQQVSQTSGKIIVLDPHAKPGSEAIRILRAQNGAAMRRGFQKCVGQAFAYRSVHQYPAFPEGALNSIGGKLVHVAGHLEVGQAGIPAPERPLKLRIAGAPESDEPNRWESGGQVEEELGSLSPVPPSQITYRRAFRFGYGWRDRHRSGQQFRH